MFNTRGANAHVPYLDAVVLHQHSCTRCDRERLRRAANVRSESGPVGAVELREPQGGADSSLRPRTLSTLPRHRELRHGACSEFQPFTATSFCEVRFEIGAVDERLVCADRRRTRVLLADYEGLCDLRILHDIVTWPFGGLRRRVAQLAGVCPKSRVLDMATGTGAQAAALARTAGEVVGIDLSEAMLRAPARKHQPSNLTFRQADATRLPFANRSFDTVCISFALHEMPSSIRGKVLREMARVTKPNGSILVVDYGLPQRARSFVYQVVKLYECRHCAEFIRSDLDASLASAGIEVCKSEPALLGIVRILKGKLMHASGLGCNAAMARPPLCSD